MLLRILPILFLASAIFAQSPVAPPIEAGVSQELAKWRAAHYSDVRYKLNLTLEKMSPVLKGTMEIRVNVDSLPKGAKFRDGRIVEPVSTPIPAIILDWRTIPGHEKDSTISNVSINGQVLPRDFQVVDWSGPVFTVENEHIVFREGVKTGENVIKFDFTSPILTSGSAITRYVDKEDGAEYIYSLFVPSDASTAFPVFDQPDLKARFELEVDVPQDWNVVSNGAKLVSGAKTIGYSAHDPYERPTIPHHLYRHRFLHVGSNNGGRISTYVFAFAAGPWTQVSEDGTVLHRDTSRSPVKEPPPVALVGNVGGRIYVRKSQAEKFKPHAAEVFRLNREAIKYFEEYFDYKFPFPKYDLVLIPEFPFGGMEHAGATFLREASIIFPQEPTKNDHISRALLIFHEAAHQWFGDTVTMRWFDDLWLKEGFATFTAYKAMEKIMPEANAWKVFYERVKQAAYQTDSTKGTTPIYQEIKNLSAAKSAYGNIVYNKAPAFLRQAEFYLGEDKFQTAVRAFLKKNEFGNAGWEDLVKEFEAASGQKLDVWATQWVTQRGMYAFHSERHDDWHDFYDKGKKAPPLIAVTPIDILRNDSHWKVGTKVLMRYPDGSADVQPEELYASKTFGGRTFGFRRSKKPVLIFPNYGDYGYGIFLLDDKSREYVLKNIQNEKDPFLRSMMWGALWDSVREGELDPRIYVELVIKNLPTESDETITSSVLGRTSTALNYYVSDTTKAQLLPQFENTLIERLTRVETVGQRIVIYRALLNVAATANGRDVLRAMLKASLKPDGNVGPKPFPPGLYSSEDVERILRFEKMLQKLPLKSKDRFDIVTHLLILNDPDTPKLLAELEKTETSDDAKRYAYAARAGIATAENKAKYWNDFVNNKEISESWIEAAFGPWNSIRHNDLTLPYLQRALQELPNHKRNRKIFFVNGWLGAFIGGQRSEEALAIVNKFLADNPNLDKDLRLKILENVDVIERAVKIRAKYGKN